MKPISNQNTGLWQEPRSVLIGASIAPGLKGVATFRRLKLGDCVLTTLPLAKAEALALARYCREHRIRLYFSELLYRGSTDLCCAARRKLPRHEFYSKPDLEEIFDAAGECYGGRMTLGESGGMLYWPKAYLINRRAGDYARLPRVRTVTEARAAYLRELKRILAYERHELGKGPLLDVDSSLVFKYHAEAGFDVLCHEMLPGDPHLMQAAIRGAARAFGKPWGTHIAMACYGGVSFDPLWLKRWKTSLDYCYLTGSQFIWPECGHYESSHHQTGKVYKFNSQETRAARRILREVYQFSRIHTRPPEGPHTTLGVVHGHCDGAPGLWNRYVWGQFHDRKWLAGAPERGWELVDFFHRRQDWPSACVQGDQDFSGQPPYGQYDVVPIEADLGVLRRYTCLVFLAWNTMTDEIYAKLKAYVAGGGRLVMSLAHLGTQTDRARPLRLFRNGDLRDLFGVRILGHGRKDVWGTKCMANSSLPSYRFPLESVDRDPRFLGEFTPARVKVATARVISGCDDFYFVKPEALAGRPVLVENSVGKGKAFLATVWEHPAADGMLPFTRDVLRTVLAGEQGDLRLLAPDRVRYAVYAGKAPPDGRRYRMVYLLNTDPDVAAPVRLWLAGRETAPFTIPANEMLLAYCFDRLVVIPGRRQVELCRWETNAREARLVFSALESQTVAVHNLGVRPAALVVNGRRVRLDPGGSRTVKIRRNIDPSRRRFYAADFLEEPTIRGADPRTPY